MTLEFVVDGSAVRFEESLGKETEWIREHGGEAWMGYVDDIEVGHTIKRPDADSARSIVSLAANLPFQKFYIR